MLRTMTSTTEPAHIHTSRCWWKPDDARWQCPSADDRPLVDVRDMIVVHTALLREFRLAPAAVARVTAGDTSSVAAVDRHLGLVCDLLHHHHEGEDALLWPLLRERVPVAAQALVNVAESQHAGLDVRLTTVATARTCWRDQPGEAQRDRLVAALEDLHADLKAHLDAEERTVLPLAAGVLTDAEWAAIGAAGAAGVPKPALLLVFGMFAYEGDPAVLRTMLATAPPLARRIVPRLAPASTPAGPASCTARSAPEPAAFGTPRWIHPPSTEPLRAPAASPAVRAKT